MDDACETQSTAPDGPTPDSLRLSALLNHVEPHAELSVGLPPAEQVLVLLADAESRSAQLEVLQKAWSAAGRPILADDCIPVLGKLNKADSRSAQLRVLEHAGARLSTYSALDAAAKPLVLSGVQFQHLAKLVRRASAGGMRADAFASLLDQAADELGAFLSAAQVMRPERPLELAPAPPGCAYACAPLHACAARARVHACARTPIGVLALALALTLTLTLILTLALALIRRTSW